ncbi:hypothetical protein JM18_009109, partial [Phytophthora kernoviae]
SISGKLSYVDFSNVTLNGIEPIEADPYMHKTCPALVGQNMAAGTEDGRALSMFTEGNLEGNIFFEAIGAVIKKTPQWM